MLATADLIDEADQPRRLEESLSRCLGSVPLYRSPAPAPASGPAAGRPALALFPQLPFITKRDIRRDFPRNFLGEDADIEALVEEEVIELERTSGTSEDRTQLLLPWGWWAEQERRALELNPVAAELLTREPAARRVTLNSPSCSGDICYTGVPSRDDRIVGNALFLSLSKYPFLWSEADLARMAAEAREWEPQFLDMDPVYGVVFALYCERHGIRLPSLRFILASYEFVSTVHRRILQRVFEVPVLNLYGSTETGHLLMEDQSGEMRPSLETAFLELVEPDASGVGELVVTTLTNAFMPLIRYRIGDLAERFEHPYGTRYRVHGRAADAFKAGNGRRVTTWQVDQAFAGIEGIAHYQLSELAGGRWILRFVPEGKPPTSPDLELLRQRLRPWLEIGGDLEIQMTEALMPEGSGKFRLGYPNKAPASSGA